LVAKEPPATDFSNTGESGSTSAVDTLDQTRTGLRLAARTAIGIGGEDHPIPRLKELVAESGWGWYPIVALSIYYFVDQAISAGFNVLAPDIGLALGLTAGTAAQLAVQRNTGFLLVSLQFAAQSLRNPRRRQFTVGVPISACIALIVLAYTTPAWLVWLAGGVTVVSAPVWAFHRPLLMDYYPSNARVRMFSLHQAGAALGFAGGSLAVIALGKWAHLTWRGDFVALGVFFLILCLVASRIKEPPMGTFDTDRIRGAVRSASGIEDSRGPQGDKAHLGISEAVKRLFIIATVRRIYLAMAVLGTVVYPLNTFLSFHLEERWNIGLTGRALFFAGTGLFALPALAGFAPRGEQLLARDPARLMRTAGWLMTALAVLIFGSALLPNLGAAVVGFGLVYGISAVLSIVLPTILLSVLRPYFRPTASALSGIILIGLGGQLGAFLLGDVSRRYGSTVAIIVLAFPALLAAWLLVRAGDSVNENLDSMVGEVVENEEVYILRSQGAHIPLLACRNIEHWYGQIQVLFKVNFTVDDGEMVGLLGTNGAGKTTLLRVISGLSFPSSGTVYFQGEDITYMEAERRLELYDVTATNGPVDGPTGKTMRVKVPVGRGPSKSDAASLGGLAQVPGERAVFRQMTVLENLKVMGFPLGRDRKRLNTAIDQCFEVFPILYERRGVKAASLSGGEQQMLGLSKAFIVRPRILLIDELSLGLAPQLVARLLEMVKRINQTGTAVVMVEQSVNVALAVVNHAYFMEKGQITFDGTSADLLAHKDIMQAVFLDGVSDATKADS
jgi:ABC-type branched-subunit amino acid transport system ATPase component/MFS family permease